MRVKLSTPKKSAYMMVAAISLIHASVTAQTYPAPTAVGPSASYSFPAAFSAFTPPVTGAVPAAGTPEIAEWTRINDPGDTMVVTGESFSKYSGDAEGRDTRFTFYGQSGASPSTVDGLIQRLDGREAAVMVPTALPLDGMYLVWAQNENGAGLPAAVNQAESWWVGPSKAVAGETFSVYGRNLTLGSGKSYLYIEGLNRWLTSVSENPYKADFLLPADVAKGTYKIWAHNGHGREYGWSSSLSLSVVSGFNWNGNTINVKNAPYNAKGDGSSDDRAAIQAAINAANNGDTVYIPAGTYLISNRLTDLGGVRVMGAGMNQTTIRTHSSMAAGASMFWGENGGGFVVKDLTVHSGNYLSGQVLRARSGSNIRLENVRWSQENSTVRTDLIDLSGASFVTFSGCEFYPARNVFVGGSKQIRFENCDWYGIYDCNVLLSVWGADELSVYGNTAQHADDSSQTDGSGWCKGRFVWGSGHGGVHRNLYFGSLELNDLHPRYNPNFSKYEQPVDQNSGENIMFELTATHYEGRPSEVSGNRVRLSGATSSINGNIVVITDGKGVGQSRMVVSHDVSSGWIDVDQPWRVVPNTGSMLTIGNYVNRMAVYGSFFDGHERLMDPLSEGPAALNNTATTAVSVYGGFQDLVVANNTIQQARQGIISWGFGYAYISPGVINNLQPNYFNYFAENSIDSCFDGIVNVVATFNSLARSPGTVISYNTWRKNELSNITHAAVVYHAPFDEMPIGMCIFQDNTVNSSGKSISNSDNLENQIWIGNEFNGGGSGTAIEFSDGHVPVLRDNTWSGFSKVYGTSVGPVLELPTRTVVIGDSSGEVSVPVLNCGTESMSWSASSSASWLQLSSGSGSIANEKDLDMLAMTVDEAAVASGTVEPAIITVQAEGQVKEMTIFYDASATTPVTPPPPTNPPAPVLSSIAISGPVSVNEGTSADYTCTATYSDGSKATVAPVWSENAAFASIDTNGRLTIGDIGADSAVTVSATYNGKSASFNLTAAYVPPVITHIEISGPGSVTEGQTAQYFCTAHYSDGSLLAVSPAWSDNSSAATISSGGLLAAGNVSSDTSVTLTAGFAGKTDTHVVTIKFVPPTLTGLTILGALSMDEETSSQFSCVGNFSDGTTAVVAPIWSESSAFASISGSGLLTAGDVEADTSVLITASLSGQSDTHSVTIKYVAPYVTGIAISGPELVNEESSAQFTCESIYSDGTRKSINPTWSVSAGTATISSSGLLSSGNVASDESATVTATFDGKTDRFNLTIAYVAPTITGLAISGPVALDEGTAASYTCTANYSDGSTAPVTPVWSANVSFVNISSSGVLTAGDVATDRSATLTASIGGYSANYTVTVRYVAPPVTISSIVINAPTVVNELSSEQLTCTATFSDGTTANVNPIWSVDNPVASIDASGLLRTANVEADSFVLVQAVYNGKSTSHAIGIWSVGTQVIYPLTGFGGKTVKARLWDETAQAWIELGEMNSPEELVIENVVEGQWYWINVEEWNAASGSYEVVHSSWISM